MLDTSGFPYVDGARGRIGLITPAPGSSTEWEFNHYKPGGVAVLTTRIPLYAISYESIAKMNTYVDEAAEMLAKSALVDLILFSCTAGSFLEGAGHDRKMIHHLEELTGGVKVITTSTCVLDALKALDVQALNVVTPYSDEINQRERAFLEQCGLNVLSISGALLQQSQNTPRIPPEVMYQYALEADTPDADAMFISCTGLHVDTIIEPLEEKLGKPVLTSNQCGLWGSLRAMGIQDRVPGLGQLFCH